MSRTEKDMFIVMEKAARVLIEEVFEGIRDEAVIRRYDDEVEGAYEVILKGLNRCRNT